MILFGPEIGVVVMSLAVLVAMASEVLVGSETGMQAPPATLLRSSENGGLPRYTISAIRFEGSGPRPGANIQGRLLSRVGEPLDQQKVNADLRTLMRARWYSSIQLDYEESPFKSGKVILTFVVDAKATTK